MKTSQKIKNRVLGSLKMRGSSLASVGRKLGVTRSYVCQVLSGKEDSLVVRKEISRVSHIPVKDIWPEGKGAENEAYGENSAAMGKGKKAD